MTRFEQSLVPQSAVGELEIALDGAFSRFGLDVARCQLIGGRNDTVVEVIVHPTKRPAFHFKIALEDIVDGSLGGNIDTAFRAELGTPELM